MHTYFIDCPACGPVKTQQSGLSLDWDKQTWQGTCSKCGFEGPGRVVNASVVRNPKPCGSHCECATGSFCQCSCGGLNHGVFA